MLCLRLWYCMQPCTPPPPLPPPGPPLPGPRPPHHHQRINSPAPPPPPAQTRELSDWEAQIAARRGALLEATRSNTGRLGAIATLTRQQRGLEATLGLGRPGMLEDPMAARRQQVCVHLTGEGWGIFGCLGWNELGVEYNPWQRGSCTCARKEGWGGGLGGFAVVAQGQWQPRSTPPAMPFPP
jgi:hypothetical protein